MVLQGEDDPSGPFLLHATLSILADVQERSVRFVRGGKEILPPPLETFYPPPPLINLMENLSLNFPILPSKSGHTCQKQGISKARGNVPQPKSTRGGGDMSLPPPPYYASALYKYICKIYTYRQI